MTLVKNPEQLIHIPLCTPSSSLAEMYALLLAIRLFESSLLEMFGKGVLAGTTHTCLGQEATAAGVISALDKDKDIIFSNHRGHGHFLAYCGQVESLYLEIMGKPGGVCDGKGGSQHLHWKNFYSNGIQGGIVPVATGMAMAEKMRGTQAIVTVFLGDGTWGEGAVYEALNIASLWELPLFIVVEHNGYAQSTPSHLQMAGTVADRLKAFQIPVQELTTTDVREVTKIADQIVRQIRKTARPHALVVHALRMGPHSKGDDMRSSDEMARIRANDPLNIMEPLIAESVRLSIQQRITDLISSARIRALEKLPYA